MKEQNNVLPYLLPVRCVIFLFVFLAGAAVPGRKLEEISNWWSVTASLVNVVTIIILLVFAKKEKKVIGN